MLGQNNVHCSAIVQCSAMYNILYNIWPKYCTLFGHCTMFGHVQYFGFISLYYLVYIILIPWAIVQCSANIES